jgi:hypothetical protein
MCKELESIMFLLQSINNQITKPIFTDKEIKEELDNAVDAKKLTLDINLLLRELAKTDIRETDSMIKNLILLHLKLSDSIWHIEQVHEMVKTLIAKYPDSL